LLAALVVFVLVSCAGRPRPEAASSYGPGTGVSPPASTSSSSSSSSSSGEGGGAPVLASPTRAEVRGARAAPRAMVPATLSVPEPLRRGAFAQSRELQVRDGFTISVFALVSGARSMTLAPWGDLLVTRPGQGQIVDL